MKPFTLFPLISLLLAVATWLFSADIIPQAQQGGLVNESCVADSAMLPRHTVVADVDYAQKTLRVEQRIAYQNQTDGALSEIVLVVDTNRWANTFFLGELKVNNAFTEYTLVEKRLSVILPTPLGVGCEVGLLLKFELHVPQIGAGLITDSKGYFGYTPRQLNLGHWLPTLAIYDNGRWVTNPAFYIGEQELIALADWSVMFNLINPPETLTIAAPGEETRINDRTWQYSHRNSRDFSASMSDMFNVAYEFLQNGTQVELYTFTDVASEVNSTLLPEEIAVHALRSAVQSFEMFADLFGAYPYQRLLVIQGDFPDGMEFSGLVFVGNRWFVRYNGDPASYLTLITVHEVAHQWWYALVGNDPAITPWLDEALATYSEYIFLEEYYPDLREWWWEFRVNQYMPEGFVDATIYDFPNVRAYINAVYLRGVKMLHEIRGVLGKDAFFDLLMQYAQTQQGDIALSQDFWALMTAEQLADTQPIRSRYLRVP